nr:DMT family transporter [Sphingomonas colocasiae]
MSSGVARQQGGGGQLFSIALLVLPPLIWASLIVVGSALFADVPALPLTLWSWAVALGALLPLAGRDLLADRAALRGEAPWIALLGACGTTWFQYLWFEGLTTAQPVSVAILTATLPMMVAAAAWLILRELPWRPVAIACLLTLAAGAMLVDRGSGGGIGRGELLILAANLLMTIYTIGSRLRRWRCSPLSFMTIAILGGLISLLPFAALTGGFGAIDAIARHWAAMLYLGIGAYILAYLAWNRSLIVNGATRTAFALALQPLFGAGFAACWLGATVTHLHLLALAMTLAALALIVRAQSANPSS